MKEIYYVYNNEALGSCIFLSVLKNIKSLDLPKSCLILPFLLDDKSIKYLKSNKETELNLEAWMEKQPTAFYNFNKRYLSLLPITINSLMILYKSNQIEIGKNISIREAYDLTQYDLGKRYLEIHEVIPSFILMIEKLSSVQLYDILGIQL